MRRSAPLFLVLALAVAGCLEQRADSEAEHRFGGSFAQGYSSADIEDFQARMERHGGDVLLMESHPPQFHVQGFGLTGCKAAYAEAKGLPYLASTSECRPVVHSSGGGDATSTQSG